jgi:hypothetical protein
VKRASASPANSPGWTFTITLWLLGLFAAFQLLAVIWKVVPATIVRVATAPSAAPAFEELEITEVFRPAPTPVPSEPSAPAIDPIRLQEAMTFVEQADRDARVGNWEGVLLATTQALEILGPDPDISLQQAFALGRLGREIEATEILQTVLANPDLDPQLRTQAMELRNYFSQTISNMEALGIQPGGPTTLPADEMDELTTGGPVVESIGLQPGAALGIVDVREILTDQTKTLRIAIKSRPDSSIAAAEVKVMVYFFEKGPEGEVFLTNSPVTSEWISPPIDWTDNEPEIIDVIYRLPAETLDSNIFHGYIVAIYFRDELQDTRAVPGELDQQFPPALFLDNML